MLFKYKSRSHPSDESVQFCLSLGKQIGSIPDQKATEYMSSARPRQCCIFLSVLEDLCNPPLVLTAWSLLNRHFPPSTVFPKLFSLTPLSLVCNPDLFQVIQYISKGSYWYFREEKSYYIFCNRW